MEIEQKSTTIIADNTKPIVSITKPLFGVYFFNHKLFPSSSPVIFGSLMLECNITDDNPIEQTKIFIDTTLGYEQKGEITSWLLDTRLFGKHVLRVVAYDIAGNQAESLIICKIFNIL